MFSPMNGYTDKDDSFFSNWISGFSNESPAGYKGEGHFLALYS